jgi:hypothetical protein
MFKEIHWKICQNLKKKTIYNRSISFKNVYIELKYFEFQITIEVKTQIKRKNFTVK